MALTHTLTHTIYAFKHAFRIHKKEQRHIHSVPHTSLCSLRATVASKHGLSDRRESYER